MKGQNENREKVAGKWSRRSESVKRREGIKTAEDTKLGYSLVGWVEGLRNEGKEGKSKRKDGNTIRAR